VVDVMKHVTKILVIVFILIAITVPVLADDTKSDDIIVKPLNPVKVAITYIPFQKSIITTIMEIIGMEEPKEKITEIIENAVDVYISDMKIATIPDKSKFADMEVHDVCLIYQYGTNNWYDCERSLL
jgi:hypothetical protein